MDLYKHAKSYIEKGCSVIPVGKDKKPLVKWQEFQNKRATDEELKRWFGEGSSASGIGIVTGKISNLSVVDVDTYHGGKTDGLPPTMISKTQSGGWHYYYRYLPGLPNKANIRQGVDIRSDGGYVIAPPSVGENGSYEWVLDEEPQPFPVETFKIDLDFNKAPKDWGEIAKGAAKGSRNQTAAEYCGKLIKSFDPKDWESAVWYTMLGWNKQNSPPLPETELRAVFNSITSREVRKRQGEVTDDVPVILMSDAAKKFSQDLSVAYPTGFKTVDDNTKGGIRSGNLIIVVGQTGHGKTTWSRSLTKNMLGENVPSVWFTFELTIADMWEKFEEMGMEDTSAIYTPESYVSRKLPWLKKKIIEARDIHKCKVVYIDHLGFLVSEYDGGNVNGLNQNLATVYTMICRDLKTIALQEGMIIVLMWHLKKLPRGKREPEMDDIKDSSGILQEADLAVAVTREDSKNLNNFGTVLDVYSPFTWVKMLKNRSTGSLKRFKCRYDNGLLYEEVVQEEQGDYQKSQTNSDEDDWD